MTQRGVRRFSLESLTSELWRNGAGVTRTIARNGSKERWDWRVSIADITQCGPFSPFPAMQRHLTLIEGSGIVLHGASGSVRLTRVGDCIEFPGEWLMHVELIDGTVRVCNVITRRATVTAFVAVRRGFRMVAPYTCSLRGTRGGHARSRACRSGPFSMVLGFDGVDAMISINLRRVESRNCNNPVLRWGRSTDRSGPWVIENSSRSTFASSRRMPGTTSSTRSGTVPTWRFRTANSANCGRWSPT